MRKEDIMIRVCVFTVASALLFAGCAADEDEGDSSLTIENASSYSLIEINLSPEDTATWGGDLLGNELLEPGDTLLVTGISCNTYDIRVVDEDSDECVLESESLCFDNAVWRLTDADLVACAFSL
jgi:hypothetical protein